MYIKYFQYRYNLILKIIFLKFLIKIKAFLFYLKTFYYENYL